MAKVLLVSNEENTVNSIQKMLTSYEVISACDETLINDILKVENPDIVIIDCDIKLEELKPLYRHIKKAHVIIMLLLGENPINKEFLNRADLFITKPVKKDILIASIEASLKNRNSIIKLFNSNQELARSLYQLNVLYNTSSQLAGTLDKDKLLSIINEGIEKSLSNSLSCTLIFRTPDEPVLIINSLYNISDELLEALKIRTVLNYKSSDRVEYQNINPDKLKVEKNIKYNVKEYDFAILRYPSLFDTIYINDEFFGFIEIYREANYTTDDKTCFQTLVQQGTLPLQSAILHQTLKENNRELEKLERLKSEFISIVSHELRTPLTAIKNSLDIILSGKAGDMTQPMENFVHMAKRNSERLSLIINDLLDLSKIEAGKMDFKFAITTIEPVINDVITSLSSVAKDKDINLKYISDNNNVEIYADASRLEQVLTNLVSNAIKFTPKGDIKISAKVLDAEEITYNECFKPEMKDLKGEYLTICVEDKGIGIEEKDLIHVFDKFSQIERSTQREVGGTGLGLSIAKQLLDAHNGFIWCDSVINKGSKFYFAIPVANERRNFYLQKKQLLQKAKADNSTLLIIKINSNKENLEQLLAEEEIKNSNYLNNSLIEPTEDGYVLTALIQGGDKHSAEFIKKRIEDIIKRNKTSYGECDIILTYKVEGEANEENSYSR